MDKRVPGYTIDQALLALVSIVALWVWVLLRYFGFNVPWQAFLVGMFVVLGISVFIVRRRAKVRK